MTLFSVTLQFNIFWIDFETSLCNQLFSDTVCPKCEVFGVFDHFVCEGGIINVILINLFCLQDDAGDEIKWVKVVYFQNEITEPGCWDESIGFEEATLVLK